MSTPAPERTPRGARTRAYAVHAYTAFGVAFAFLAAAELSRIVTVTARRRRRAWSATPEAHPAWLRASSPQQHRAARASSLR